MRQALVLHMIALFLHMINSTVNIPIHGGWIRFTVWIHKCGPHLSCNQSWDYCPPNLICLVRSAQLQFKQAMKQTWVRYVLVRWIEREWLLSLGSLQMLGGIWGSGTSPNAGFVDLHFSTFEPMVCRSTPLVWWTPNGVCGWLKRSPNWKTLNLWSMAF